MIVVDYAEFPNNVVLVLVGRFATIVGVDAVLARPLNNVDPDTSIGVFAADWTPRDYEIGKNADPAIGRYTFAVQALVRHADEVEGLAQHAYLSKRVRSMVYRDTDTRVALAELRYTDTSGAVPVVERAQRWEVQIQRFLTREANGTFLYMSTLEFWLETETI